MNKKASAVIVTLWVLVIFTILVVNIGHRVSLSLKLSRYQRDRLKGFCSAKAAVNQAIIKILNNEIPNQETGATVTDEESKININTVPGELLVGLLDKVKINNSSEIANNICAWRGDIGAEAVDYQDLGYSNKGGKFLRPEELLLVKGMIPESYDSLKGLITVYGAGKININTAPQVVLEILADYCVKKGADLNFPSGLAEKIMDLHQQGKAFESLDDLKMEFTQAQTDILNNLADTESTCFYISPEGKANIKTVFDLSNKKIIYWHEN